MHAWFNVRIFPDTKVANMENDFRIMLGDIIDKYVTFDDSVQGA